MTQRCYALSLVGTAALGCAARAKLGNRFRRAGNHIVWLVLLAPNRELRHARSPRPSEQRSSNPAAESRSLRPAACCRNQWSCR